jgi:hypothetical protein
VSPSGQHVAAVGYYEGSATFGATTLFATDQREVFVTRLDASGSATLARSIPADDTEFYGFGVDAFDDGAFTVVGRFVGTLDLGLGPTSAAGGRDAFAVHHRALDGAPVWWRPIGATADDGLLVTTSDASGTTYAGGYVHGTTQLDDGVVAADGSSQDAVVLRFAP